MYKEKSGSDEISEASQNTFVCSRELELESRHFCVVDMHNRSRILDYLLGTGIT
mgnify:CR=1 FL=1